MKWPDYRLSWSKKGPGDITEWIDNLNYKETKIKLIEVVCNATLWILWRYRNDVHHAEKGFCELGFLDSKPVGCFETPYRPMIPKLPLTPHKPLFHTKLQIGQLPNPDHLPKTNQFTHLEPDFKVESSAGVSSCVEEPKCDAAINPAAEKNRHFEGALAIGH
ncbi:hypothetical protein LXL04_013009 [Taraxacum kok-saghyz]